MQDEVLPTPKTVKLLKKNLCFGGNSRFSTAFTKARHCTMSGDTPTRYTVRATWLMFSCYAINLPEEKFLDLGNSVPPSDVTLRRRLTILTMKVSKAQFTRRHRFGNLFRVITFRETKETDVPHTAPLSRASVSYLTR